MKCQEELEDLPYLAGRLQFQVSMAPPKQVAELLVKHFMSP